MGSSSHDNVLIAVIGILLGIVVLITSAIILILLRVKKREQKSKRSIKGKKPSLKLDIRKSDLPLFVEDAPSPAYQILTENQSSELQHAGFPSQGGVRSIPTTPDTPGFIPQTPGYIPDDAKGTQASYSRSLSVPGDTLQPPKRSGEESPTVLWRSAVHKAARLHVFDLSPRKLNRISICPHGKIKFSLIFNSQLQELHVRVLDLIDLPLAKESGLSFPFIKMYFLLEETNSNSNLVEILSYPKDTSCSFTTFSYNTVRQSTLRFVILEYDRFSRTEFVAEAVAYLKDVDLDGAVESRHLSVKSEAEEKHAGLLMISLCYQPNNNRMSMVILKASDLPSTEGHYKPDYFIKITLLHKNQVMDKRRTKVAKKSTCPHFNERLSFPCEEAAVKDISFVFDVVRYESRLRHEKNQSIGNVVIGNNFSGREIGPLELHHFREMLNSPQKQVSEWHRVIPCTT